MSNKPAEPSAKGLISGPGEANVNKSVLEALDGRFPLKLVTGHQETTGLNFDLKPGAIVAHPGSAVVFVCG